MSEHDETADIDLMLPEEVAEKYRVDPRTITRWLREGRFPEGAYTRTLGGHYRFHRAAIERLITGEVID